MTMAFSGMDKDERQASQESISGRWVHWKKLSFGTLYRTIMLANVSVDVVEGARPRVKGVLGVSVRSQGRG